MGKRKSAKPLRPKAKEKLDVVFHCPFCNHSKCVETRLDRKRSLGTLFCRVCDANYAMKISVLTKPIDIYAEWIDRCEELRIHEVDSAVEESQTKKINTTRKLAL